MKSITKRLLLIIFLLLSVTFLTNCSKDDPPPAPTVEEMLTADTWYQESQSNVAFNDCQKHSSYRFLASGNFIVEVFYENSDEYCVSISGAGHWELTSDTDIHITSNSGASYIFAIVNISEEELVVLTDDDLTGIFDKNPGEG